MYTEIFFNPVSEEVKDILIARLGNRAEGFEEVENGLKVFFNAEDWDQEAIEILATEYELHAAISSHATQNWNALWESNFEPVKVDDFVMVRASFHKHAPEVEHEIVINPKMSFGTGHHATTWLMMHEMKEIDFSNKSVFDFGTGTGLLAILAKKLGAAKVLATDIDDWSIENAKENFNENRCETIELIQSDSAVRNRKFDVILANINKNVLLSTIPALTMQLNKGGILLLSGLLSTDEMDIVNCATLAGVKLKYKILKDNWLCLKFAN